MFHNWVISQLKAKLSRDYSNIAVNFDNQQNNEFEGKYPDMILSSHGLVMAIVEVETESTITKQKAQQWKEMSNLGAKLIIMVPQNSKAKIMDILFNAGIAQNVSIGSYEFKITMP
ncbi:hypothetical protein MCHI_002323 [Candidatus Magnetoovum chiemensis]|nr:hypothetical protein MCHI_002323 [Candidatus Magnetoovum chiemensis]